MKGNNDRFNILIKELVFSWVYSNVKISGKLGDYING